MTVSKYEFRTELRRLIEIHIGRSNTFEDYAVVTGELEEAMDRLNLESEKFSDEEVDACEL